jgi:hypothetical protein
MHAAELVVEGHEASSAVGGASSDWRASGASGLNRPLAGRQGGSECEPRAVTAAACGAVGDRRLGATSSRTSRIAVASGGAAAVASRNPLAAPGVLVELAAVGEQQHWQRRKEDAL